MQPGESTMHRIDSAESSLLRLKGLYKGINFVEGWQFTGSDSDFSILDPNTKFLYQIGI